MKNAIELTRDCEAAMIPSGVKVLLKKGARVVVSQALGGAYTVVTDAGYLARISGVDADAIGQEPAPAPPSQSTADASLEGRVWNALRTVYDPEIPVDVVELGLVYGVDIRPAEGGSDVVVRMTLTAPGCGIGDVLKDEVELLLRSTPGVRRAAVEWVWDPPWDMSRMSEAAKLQVGMF
jgi:probable FeS assembly SUF system protein SufT